MTPSRMRDKEKQLLVLLKRLDEKEFAGLIENQGSEKDALLEKLIGRDPRWITVLPILEQYLRHRKLIMPLFEQKKNTAWNNISGQIKEPLVVHSSYYLKYKTLLKIAAMLICVCSVTLIFYANYNPDRFSNNDNISKIWKTAATSSDMIALPDGSKVWLNRNSSVAFIKSSDINSRQVKITGEAYFEVKSSKQHPFEVIGKQGVVKVTGTHFFAGTDAKNGQYYVDLLEGEVSFESYGLLPHQLKLHPNERLIYTQADNRNQYKLYSLKDKNTHLWLRKAINCNKTPLPELIRQMQIWYKADIRLTDEKLKTLHFSGTLSPEASLLANLEKLSWTSNFSYTKNNNKYLIKSRQ